MRTKLWTLVLAAAVLGFVMGGIAVSLKPASTSAAATSVATTHLQFLVKFIGQDPFLDLGTPGPSQGDEMILHDLVFTPMAAPRSATMGARVSSSTWPSPRRTAR